jgi:hypothetical protein
MSEIPDAPGGEPADDVPDDMAKGESISTADEPGGEAREESTDATPAGATPPDATPVGATPAGPTPAEPNQAATTEWWRRDPEPPRSRPSGLTAPAGIAPAGTAPAGSSESGSTSGGTPPGGTPPGGTPPEGTPPFGMPPFGAPPAGSPPGTPPWGNPQWGGPPWGGPPWGGPPPWYGWGPGWPGPVPPAQAATSPAPRTRHQPFAWVIIGCLIAAFAMVAIGLGIGYSVWGGTTTAAVTAPARGGVQAPAPRIAPGLGRSGFLGVEVVPSSLFGGATPPSATAPTRGAYVVGVVPSSPAAKAGIVKGDTITTFAGRAVNSAGTLRIDALDHAPGTKVKVAWITSSGKHESATVTLARRPKTGSIG